MENRLLYYFLKCLNAKYLHTMEGGSFALERRFDTLYIFFEHSNGKIDWKSNVDFRVRRAYSNTASFLCHRGFLLVWNSILPCIKASILDKSARKIVIVGYSHGAAVSGLCYEYVKNARRDIEMNIEGYGFGSPRFMFRWGGRSLADDSFRGYYVVRNKKDIVTHLPPRLFGFIHVGEMINIGEGSHYSPIDAHRQEGYIESLKKAKASVKNTETFNCK